MKLLDISEVAQASGWPASTLRYWESRGLIEAVGRRGLRRTFDPAVLSVLDLIGLAKDAGFPLEDIAAWIGADGRVTLDRDALRERADDLEAQAETLRSLSSMLRHTATCPAPSHFECPTFRQMLAESRARQRAVSKSLSA